MRIKIKLHPNSSRDEIKEIEPGKNYKVWIKEKPVDGKANAYLEKYLKKYFKKKVEIVSGFKSREKIVNVD